MSVRAVQGVGLLDFELRARLLERKIKITPQRMAVYRELARRARPTSHAELTDHLRGAGTDRATIYRNLLHLTDAGLLVRVHLGDHVWRYELPATATATHDRHPHFVCVQCGTVRCLPRSAVKVRGVAAEQLEVQLRGRCASCAAP